MKIRGLPALTVGEDPLSWTLAEFSAHYHGEPNHRGKGNKLLFPEAMNPNIAATPLRVATGSWTEPQN